MGYFPFFVELKGKRGLIVGGGIVAERKVRKLLPYDPSGILKLQIWKKWILLLRQLRMKH